eukprot:TRINITY_DN51636_c0_g1_i1.p1 TRINITY_DN51636_c0_g1~~TRINITY_DN51636_c0_g1_i1.p1  ORF type:complete len:175 (-),score=19.17 TRINITY_DN51636_c0_g1_i1:101-625(-)
MAAPNASYHEFDDGGSVHSRRRLPLIVGCVVALSTAMSGVFLILWKTGSSGEPGLAEASVGAISKSGVLGNNSVQSFFQVAECVRNTGGTCAWFNCDKFRHATCVDTKCICPEGKCSNLGVCQNPTECVQNTGATCYVMGCRAARGPTNCVGHACVCQPGFCSMDGICVRDIIY